MQGNNLSDFFWWVFSVGNSNSPNTNTAAGGGSSNNGKCQQTVDTPEDPSSDDVIESIVQQAMEGDFIEVSKVGKANCYTEWHPSIPAMLETFRRRKHNKSFEGRNSSHGGNRGFTGTDSYAEAERLCLCGCPELLESLDSALESVMYEYNMSKKSLLQNTVVGYCPNVPNALMNLPNSMFLRELARTESKTLHIVFCNSVSCGESTENMTRAGVQLLAAINILELKNYSIRLDICFDGAHDVEYNDEVGEYACNLIKIKDFGEPLDLLKLSFPIAHPSMARRIGFAALETMPTIKAYYRAYGRPMSIEEYKECLNLHKDIIVLDVRSLKYNTIQETLKLISDAMAN